jgi:UV DNA damage endonuclease
MDLYRMQHILNTPITFDYLHHKCHPGNMPEDSALVLASLTWGAYVPLFHYSESIPGHNNPRKHADYASKLPETYNKTFDLDFEFKMKEKSFENL